MTRLLGKIWCWLFGHRPWEIEIDRGYVGMHRFIENGIGCRRCGKVFETFGALGEESHERR